MPLIEWQDRFRIGIASVDYEHEEMIALLNELHAGLTEGASRNEMMGFLGEIHARIAAHFALEEKVMKERGYDQFIVHKTDHEDLLDQISDILDDYALGDAGSSVEEFGKRMEAWFGDHFRTHDARLHQKMADLGVEFGQV